MVVDVDISLVKSDVDDFALDGGSLVWRWMEDDKADAVPVGYRCVFVHFVSINSIGGGWTVIGESLKVGVLKFEVEERLEG